MYATQTSCGIMASPTWSCRALVVLSFCILKRGKISFLYDKQSVLFCITSSLNAVISTSHPSTLATYEDMPLPNSKHISYASVNVIPCELTQGILTENIVCQNSHSILLKYYY